MTENLNEEIRKQMFENFYRMKKIRARYATMLYMSGVLIFIQLIFFMVGGLNLWMLIGVIMNIVVFLTGTKKYDNPKLLYILMIINLAAAGAFIIIRPVSDVLLRLGTMQHLYLALESYMFVRLGEQKTELSYELGYPYFTELASYQMEEKKYEYDYIPNDAVSSGTASMDNLMKNEDSDDLKNHISSAADYSGMQENTVLGIPDIDTENMKYEFNEPVKADVNIYAELYKKKPEKRNREPEYDKELFAANRNRMKRYKFFQGALFAVDLVLLYITFTDALTAFFDMFKNPFESIRFFPLIGVIIASVLTVTCLDNKTNLKCGLYAFTCCGVVFSTVLLNSGILFVFLLLAGQMLISAKLADEADYLKKQFGYPYFKESTNYKMYTSYEYTPEHDLNFKNNGMDDL